MDLEQFAKMSGVKLVECDKSWGGTIGYTMDDHPNCTYAGFRTEQAAYKDWLSSTFGDQTSKALLKLLKESDKKQMGEKK